MSPTHHYPFPLWILRPERANKNEDMEVLIMCFGCENKTNWSPDSLLLLHPAPAK